jgi:hypothetical protein
LVRRATRPSRLSSTAATKMPIAAWSKLRFIACTIAKKPKNSAASVNRLGRM